MSEPVTPTPQQREQNVRTWALRNWDEAIARDIARAEAEAEYRRQHETKPIKAGQLIVLTDGSYSDYCLWGVVRALADFDLVKEKQDCPSVTIAHLVKSGLAEELDHEEVNLDDWGNGATR
jgi:hypothetical protein